MSTSRFYNIVNRIIEHAREIVIGKDRELKILIATIIVGGHVLLEGVPGVAKTLMARVVAASFDLSFKRIQFTPDLLPSDIIGTKIFNPKTGEFETRRGPIFANIVLADEVNRASPRTQSALLEAMQEKQVTIEGETHRLPEPFTVIATQNPIELEGTFPLPEAQLDRFTTKIVIEMPGREILLEILRKLRTIVEWPVARVATAKDILEARKLLWEVEVSDPVREYIVSLVEATHRHRDVRLGASPRAAIALQQIARALAAFEGRDYVIPDDVKKAAPYVLVHRVILKPEAELEGVTGETVVKDVLASVEVPVP